VASRIEDYGLIGDLQTAALVGRDGSIDWLCLPRFDSGACFAALLGGRDDGHWTIAPADGGSASSRRYVGESLVLESTWDSTGGTVRVTDFMPHRHQAPDIVRIVDGVRGRVAMQSVLRLRFDYGRRVPWVRRSEDHQIVGLAGPDAVYLSTDVETRGEDFSTVADFTIAEGDRVRFVLTWNPSQDAPPKPVDADRALAETLEEWTAWAEQCRRPPRYADAVVRSLVTLKALTYGPTGGVVAAPTTSLPENLGGVRNWDYRYCWLRDASLALEAMLAAGYTEEAAEWRSWLLRAIAGSPRDMQIMYGVAGETRLLESTCDWLGGYEDSAPVRIGNAAATQSQLDVFGEVIDALRQARAGGIRDVDFMELQIAMADHLESVWDEPDEGLWEVRGPRQQFTHSKVMCWVAFDRLARVARRWGRPELEPHWREMADLIHARICQDGWNDDRGAFTQAFGSDRLDAALLMLPRLGFLPADDPRIVSTVEAVQRELTLDGLVMRYQSADAGSTHDIDGLPGGEGSFVACSFWLADALHRIGRTDEAREMFERVLDLRNDLGMLAEEYDPRHGRQVGNFPQAFSHIGLVTTAYTLTGQSSTPDG
jgi:GH15 family glucan-1,4-alpha-glucosidase